MGDERLMPAGTPEFSGTERFAVLRRIGAGGMGVVYEAIDRERGMKVALKTMQRVDATALYRFKREFRALADESHPNLAALYDLFTEGAVPFFTMELLRGSDFLAHLRGRAAALAPTEADPKAVTIPAVNASTGERCDLELLRQTLSQLVTAVSALHSSGKIHRDLKPSNVLVTEEGRIVLLDFGLVTSMSTGPADALRSMDEHAIVGTAAYMSPEQARGEELSEATDWYSVGVMLYEALTGRLPFDGSVARVLLDKQERVPPRPSELAPVPADLDTLCMQLLEREAPKRPTGGEILRALGSGDALVVSRPRTSPASGVQLIGREPHLAQLHEAFRRTQQGQPIVVDVVGSTGMGKSSLLARFAEEVLGERAVVLAGRCYEREAVPFKAFDSAVDGLTRHLHGQPPEVTAALLPRHVLALARIFPVLLRVPAIASFPGRSADIPDQAEAKRRAFAAFRELLHRLADRSPVVLVLDDLQWGDTDSAQLLAEIVRSPDAPPLLIVLSYRREEAETSPFLSALRDPKQESLRGVPRVHVEVNPLTQPQAERLATLLFGTGHGDARATRVAQECHGSPYFVDELVRFAGARDALDTLPLRLDDALHERIALLPDPAARLLRSVAVASGVVLEEDALQAADLASDEARKAVTLLKAEHLLRSVRGGVALDTFHDRVRETLLAHLDPEERRSLHAKLAAVLLATGRADPERLTLHFGAAGDTKREAEFAIAAARKAEVALAFDRASELYERALHLGVPDDQRLKLQTALGDALANGGRGVEAAAAYEKARALTSGDEAIRLRHKEATQLLMSGVYDRGNAAMNEVLIAVGLAPARPPWLAVVLVVWRTLWRSVWGHRFRERSSAEVSAHTRARLDILYSATQGFLMTNAMPSFELGTRHTSLALAQGDTADVALSLASEAANNAHIRRYAGFERSTSLGERAALLARKSDSRHVMGTVGWALATATFAMGRFAQAVEQLETSEAHFVNDGAAVGWDLSTTRAFRCWSLFYLGELAAMAELASREAVDARRRGDPYSLLLFTIGLTHVVNLMTDSPEDARGVIDDSMAFWSGTDITLQHYYGVVASGFTDLYEGKLQVAWSRFEQLRRDVARIRLDAVISIRWEALFWLGCSAAAFARGAEGTAADRQRAKRSALRSATALDRERHVTALTLASIIRAQLTLLQDDEGVSRAAFESAARACDAQRMTLFGAATRALMGERLGGDEGARMIAEAEDSFRRQGVRNPTRMRRVLVP